MSLFSRIKQKAFNNFIDIIEWADVTSDTMIWRFPHYQAEIKNGAQLTVHETQMAVLVNEGKFADIFQPGSYVLVTSSMPILTKLKGWKSAFKSPFNVDIYFVNTKLFLNQRWDTTNPIMLRDTEFGPIRMRAFGSYTFKIAPNPKKFICNIVRKGANFSPDSVSEQLRSFVVTKFTDYLAESKIAALDLAANLNEFSSELTIALKDDFSEYGIELTKFLIEDISLPKAIEETLDKRSNICVVGNKTTYAQMKIADSLKDAANNRTAIHPKQDAPPFMGPQAIYHVAINGVQQGPFPQTKLQRMAQKGQLTPDTLVWTAGMTGWKVANTVPSLSRLFGLVPPPL